jgi:hypothetical protein
MSYDKIDELPTDNTNVSHGEIQILDSLFKAQKNDINKLLNGTQDIALAGILFIAFSVKPVDDLIIKFFPSAAKSPYILLGVKTLLFMVSFFVLKNMYLAKKAA